METLWQKQKLNISNHVDYAYEQIDVITLLHFFHILYICGIITFISKGTQAYRVLVTSFYRLILNLRIITMHWVTLQYRH